MTARSLFAGAALAAFLAAAPTRASGPIPELPAPAAGRWHDASLDEYRKHLQDLAALVEACAKARDARICDPALVGADDRVQAGESGSAERRPVRYGWLRVLLAKAQEKDKDFGKPESRAAANGAPSEESALPPPPTTTELLQAAGTRLAQDLAQTNAATTAAPAHAQEREAMKQVLAGRDFRHLEEPSARDTLLEKLGNWLNKLFESAAQFRARGAWVGLVIYWGFILAVCLGLAWGLIQLERRWRNRPAPESGGPAAAVSAREWQLYLEDARRAAAAGQWREAIHFVYWAAISRLESRRLWPADRARTPREYLALVAPEDPRRPVLATLTGSFERTWYGGRAAAESDYRKAEQLAAALISGSTASAIRIEGGAAQ
ncbi:MAG: DUF4129 domain-containing protein [Terracidiphilus sp.]